MRRRYVTVRRYGDTYCVVDERGRTYYRTRNPRKAKAACARVLAWKRRLYRTKLPRTGSGNKVEIRRRGSHYTVVDRRGRIYAQEMRYDDAVRSWRKALKGLSREEARRVA